MRLNLTLSPNTDSVPFNHLHWLTGTLHKWAGSDNALHDGPSLYSVGWLKGGHAEDGALTFPDGARWRLSFWDADAVETGPVVQRVIRTGPFVKRTGQPVQVVEGDGIGVRGKGQI